MLYREIIAVCSLIHTKHTNTLCGQNTLTGLYRVEPVQRSLWHQTSQLYGCSLCERSRIRLLVPVAAAKTDFPFLVQSL